jgi:hypothetical protein
VCELTQALSWADAPALFVVWQDSVSSVRLFVDAMLQAGLTHWTVYRSNGLGWISGLTQMTEPANADEVVVLLGCLSAIPQEQRYQLNVARTLFLDIPRKIIFVESAAQEGELREVFPDIFSLVRQDIRLFARADQEEQLAAFGQATASASSHQSPSGPAGRTPLSGQIVQMGEKDALCWLEVQPGVRVKFQIPLDLLQHLHPEVGKQFLWSPGTNEYPEQFCERVPPPPDPELLREFDELSRRYHQDLKHRKQWIKGDT